MKKTALIFFAACFFCLTQANEIAIKVEQEELYQPEFGGIEGNFDLKDGSEFLEKASPIAEKQTESPLKQAEILNEAKKYQEAFTILRNALVASNLQDMELRLALAEQYVLLMEKKKFPDSTNMRDINGNLDNHINALTVHVATPQGSAIKNELNKLKKRISSLRQGSYDPQFGKTLAAASTSVTARQGRCGGSNFNRGDCYECTGKALEKALGNSSLFFSQPGVRLNRSPYYAKFFATNWVEKLHQPTFGLNRSYYSTSNYAAGQQAANKAPIGSVIVWDQCGRSPAGHIAIITSPGVACSSFCAPINNSCGTLAADGSTRVIAVFTPVGNAK